MVLSPPPRPVGAASKKELRSLLSDGRRLDDDSPTESFELLESLKNLGLVAVASRGFVRCVNPDDQDFESVEDPNCEGIINLEAEKTCPECGRVIEGIEKKHRFSESTIQHNPEGILSFIRTRLEALPCVSKVSKEERAVFRVDIGSSSHCYVVLVDDQLGFASSIKYRYVGKFFSEPVLYVQSEGTRDLAPHLLERIRFARLEDFVANTDDQLGERILSASHPRKNETTYTEVEEILDQYLKSHQWQDFQNEFVPNFYRHCQSHPQKVEEYLATLKRDKGTFFASFSVVIGGAGKTDFRLIEKLDYLQTVFKDRVIADAKFYTRTRLTSHQLDTIIRQLFTDARGSSDAVAIIFVTTDGIDSTVWDYITMLKRNTGEWKIVVIPKYLLLELLEALGAKHLLISS